MKTIKKGVFIIGLLAIAVLLINAKKTKTNEVVAEAAPKTVDLEKDNPTKDYAIYALDLPENLSFAGETVPMEDLEVYERLDREFLVNTYWQSNGLLLIKRANKYFPIIEPILKENNIPDDFKYLAVIESGLQNVTSPAGAKGFWQILRTTGRELHLEVNSNIDERYHLEKATRAACDYLQKAKDKFGSWTLAAAAYNAGNGRISKELDKQLVSNYYDLLLTEETARYVPRIVAMKYILSNPKKYGFNFENKHLYTQLPTKNITIDTTINNLASFAKNHGMNYKELKKLNPWLLQNTLNNASNRTYQLKVLVK